MMGVNCQSKRIAEKDFRVQQTMARLCTAFIIALCTIFIEPINSAIDQAWKMHISQSSIFRNETFEPFLASITFILVVQGWFVIDYYVPFFHRYRISNSDDVGISWKGRESTYVREGLWYIVPLLVIDYYIKRREAFVDRCTVAPSLPQIGWQIFLAFFVYDFLFYCGHIVQHSVPFLFRTVHAEHHHTPEVRASDTIRHTFWDGSYDVICSVLALNLTKAHPLSRALYNVAAIWLITEAHCGFDFPWMLHNILPYGLMAGPVVHGLHHRVGRVNFQKYFTYLDYCFGTLQLVDPQDSRGWTKKAL